MSFKQFTILFTSFALSGMSLADGLSNLQARLQKLQNQTANYEQKLTNEKGEVLQTGEGKIQLKYPNLFKVSTTSPQESILVSDGKNLWFYDPFVEQATVRRAKEALAQTPVALIIANNPKLWGQYTITQQGDWFTLTPKSANSNIQKFKLELTEQGEIKNFATVEKSGKTNSYQLSDINSLPISREIFSFSPPKGTEIDDQR